MSAGHSSHLAAPEELNVPASHGVHSDVYATPAITTQNAHLSTRQQRAPAITNRECTPVHSQQRTPVITNQQCTPVITNQECTPVINNQLRTPVQQTAMYTCNYQPATYTCNYQSATYMYTCPSASNANLSKPQLREQSPVTTVLCRLGWAGSSKPKYLCE